MKKNGIVGSSLAVLCLTGLVHAIDVDNPPEGLFSDEWYVLLLDGNKSGHMHATMERRSRDGEDIIVVKTSMQLVVGRTDTQISISFDQSSEETLDGKPLRFEHRMQLGKLPMTTRGRIRNGKVTITTYQFGLPTGTKTHNLPDGALMAWGTYREQIKKGLQPGLKYELSVYEPSIAPDRLTRTTMEVFEPEELDLFGRKVIAYRTRQTAHLKNSFTGSETGVETITWMTDAGTAVKMQMSVPPIDMPFEVIACTKAVALAPNEPAELMLGTLIPAGRELDSSARSITYRLISKGSGESKLVLPETAMQKIIENNNGAVTLKLTRQSARRATPSPMTNAADAGNAALTDEDLKPYLEPSADLNYKDPVVAELAKKAAGGEKDPWKLTERLCNFVHEYIETKNLSVGFASASEVARSKEGDCTEHGILLAALGRACGIPTRIVTGIVYTDEFSGRRDVFVGHLWTQFYLDGEWVDVDSAFGQTDVDPTHIALGVSAAGDSGLADLVTSGWLGLSKVGLKVLEVEE
ncbi:MAG TPA: transglutaminase family protein [Phycisphaerae bacterium]|nr:transglutaminase family protein [Phycisphaerae bacterium]HOJ73036.1 transglutaminase family protein [Phycisphaerae bacterium]HOM52653.1 transglutaminase family protein [Phycisphaerae bacterium]HON68322.1 transglutaminase family protein [Phycisphaerae bacterium]HOQ87801.1 transglutaminase family protein [Phycisphaerae bacterium]